jgi:hypothetical protein
MITNLEQGASGGGYLAGGTMALLEILKSTAMLRRRCDGHMEGRLADAS